MIYIRDWTCNLDDSRDIPSQSINSGGTHTNNYTLEAYDVFIVIGYIKTTPSVQLRLVSMGDLGYCVYVQMRFRLGANYIVYIM